MPNFKKFTAPDRWHNSSVVFFALFGYKNFLINFCIYLWFLILKLLTPVFVCVLILFLSIKKSKEIPKNFFKKLNHISQLARKKKRVVQNCSSSIRYGSSLHNVKIAFHKWQQTTVNPRQKKTIFGV